MGRATRWRAGLRRRRGDIIVMLDADGSNDPAEIAVFVDALLAGDDFAKGSRFAPGGGERGYHAVFVVRAIVALCRLVNVLFGTRYSDLCYGYNAFWRHCLAHMDVRCERV